MGFEKLKNLILSNESILVEKILRYAKERGYVKYTSTRAEAWRLSIFGLSNALIETMNISEAVIEFSPDEDYSNSKMAEFGIMEAKKHRSRGISLCMFLGLMKYYHQAYVDLIDENDFTLEEKQYFTKYVKRFFDYVELAFIAEWMTSSKEEHIQDLQRANRIMMNEKNKYLTVFESIYDPIIFVDKENNIENINHQAGEIFPNITASGIKYNNTNEDVFSNWLQKDLATFAGTNSDEMLLEKNIETRLGKKTYLVKFKKMMDISEKYAGIVITFNDNTKRLEYEQQLKEQNEKLEYYAHVDHMTGVLNRRTGLMALEKQLDLFEKTGVPLSVCFIDIDKLKDVNDTFGHAEGDQLINKIISTFKSGVGKRDIISRFGGDEFLLLFPGSDRKDIEKVVQQVIEKLSLFDKSQNKQYKHLFSYGIVVVPADKVGTANDVIKLADERMYQHKASKR